MRWAENRRLALGWLSRAPDGDFVLSVATSAPSSRTFKRQVVARSPKVNPLVSEGGPIFDSHARVLASYVEETDRTTTLNLAREADDGGFPAATALFTEGSGSLYFARVALDAADRPVIAWNRGGVESLDQVDVPSAGFVRSSDAVGNLQAPQLLRENCDVESLAVARSGAAAAALSCDGQIYVSQRAAGSAFASPRRATGGGKYEFLPSLRIAANGRVWLTWLHSTGKIDEGVPITRAQVASAAPGGRFTTRRWRTGYQASQESPSLIEGPRGQMYLAWERRRVYLRALRARHTLGKVRALTPSVADGAAFASDQSGRGIATWTRGRHLQAERFRLKR